MEKAKLWRWAAILLGIAAIMTLFATSSRITDQKLTEKRLKGEISEIRAELSELGLDAAAEEGLEDKTLGADEQSEASRMATELGKKVAGFQNAYAGIDRDKDQEKFNENVQALDACFTEQSKGARVPWHAGTKAGTWEFVEDGAFKGTGRECLWLCRAEDGTLLAYAEGVYDTASGLFTDVHFSASYAGNASVDSSGTDNGDATVNDVQGIMDDIKNADVPDVPDVPADEAADVKDAQAQLRDAMTGGE